MKRTAVAFALASFFLAIGIGIRAQAREVGNGPITVVTKEARSIRRSTKSRRATSALCELHGDGQQSPKNFERKAT
jgi:hypothetical protein